MLDVLTALAISNDYITVKRKGKKKHPVFNFGWRMLCFSFFLNMFQMKNESKEANTSMLEKAVVCGAVARQNSLPQCKVLLKRSVQIFVRNASSNIWATVIEL